MSEVHVNHDACDQEQLLATAVINNAIIVDTNHKWS